MHFLTKTLDTILPPRCPVSGDIVTEDGMVAPHIWANLDFIADPMCEVCGVPFDYTVEDTATCDRCLSQKPPYQTARAALRYSEASRDILLGFKHADKMHTVKTFTPWLKTAGADMLQKADYIAPVPLHFMRLIKRRYNQAALIAGTLGNASEKPVVKDMLIRKRATVTQGYLSREERENNVKDAFTINPKRIKFIKNKTIILVDDVYTTGATAKECTETLLENGASAVHILTIARTGRSDPLI